MSLPLCCTIVDERICWKVQQNIRTKQINYRLYNMNVKETEKETTQLYSVLKQEP